MGLGSRRGGVEGPGPAPVNLWPRPRQEWAQVRARPPRLHLQLRAFSDLSGRANGAGGGRGRAVCSQGLSHLLARAVLAPPPPLCPSPSRVPLHPRSLPLRLWGDRCGSTDGTTHRGPQHQGQPLPTVPPPGPSSVAPLSLSALAPCLVGSSVPFGLLRATTCDIRHTLLFALCPAQAWTQPPSFAWRTPACSRDLNVRVWVRPSCLGINNGKVCEIEHPPSPEGALC